jgi:long-chain acyl-CoA synthetase
MPASPVAQVSIPALFLDRCRRTPRRVAARVKEYGLYREVTWAEYRTHVERVCLGLREAGVVAGDRVAIMADPSIEWCYVDLGAQAVGAITYGIYSTSSASQVRYLLEDGRAVIAVAGNEEYVDKILAGADGLPGLRAIVVVDPEGMLPPGDGRVRTLAALEDDGRRRAEREPDLFEALVARPRPDALAYLVYTSGTSGPPKPAMISHQNCLSALVGGLGEVFPGLCTEEQRSVSYLSMAHILERSLTTYLPLAYDVVPHFGESVEELPLTLFETQPTFFYGVPRVWEKLASQVLVGAQSTSRLKSLVYRAAMWVGTRYRECRWKGARVPAWLAALYGLARLLVFRHILRKAGLLHIRYAISTGAPLPPRVQALWQIWGVDLVNMYGATEAGGIITSQRPGFPRPGDVGTPTTITAVRLGSDGDVLVSGPGVFLGYRDNERATREARDGEWLRVGEVGELDARGALRLIDRKKDIMVTAGGKNLAPTQIENALKASPYISEAVVFAEGRRYPVALIEIDSGTVAEWARTNAVAYSDFASLIGHERVQRLIADEVEQANEHLARVEQVKRFRLLPKELDPEHEDDPVTATRKVKRSLMYEQYRGLVESMYTDAEDLAAAQRHR